MLVLYQRPIARRRPVRELLDAKGRPSKGTVAVIGFRPIPAASTIADPAGAQVDLLDSLNANRQQPRPQ